MSDKKCVICGVVNSGEYLKQVWVNGRLDGEYHCPLDLCEEHMVLWAGRLSHNEIEENDEEPTEDEKEFYFMELQNLLKDMGIWYEGYRNEY